MTTARHLRCQQWVPGISENPVHPVAAGTQKIEQHDNNRQVANYKCHFERKNGLVNRGYSAEEKLSAGGIWARYIRVVQRAGFACMQRVERWLAGNEDIRVIAQSLHAAIPNI